MWDLDDGICCDGLKRGDIRWGCIEVRFFINKEIVWRRLWEVGLMVEDEGLSERGDMGLDWEKDVIEIV